MSDTNEQTYLAVPYDGLMMNRRVVVGQSVFENAVLSTRDGWLTVEFESPDLDDISIPINPSYDS